MIDFHTGLCYNKSMRNGKNIMNMSIHAKVSGSKFDRKSRLTDDTISKQLHDSVVDKIIKARVSMLWKQPFYGTLITRMQIYAADEWCPTMAVDGKYLYFNHKFVDELSIDELIFVFAHEVSHMVYDHIGRTTDYGMDHQLANCAQDYVVNDELIQLGIGTFPSRENIKGLHDVKYRGWSSEQVYEDLLKQQQNSPNSGKSLEEMLDNLLDEHLNGIEQSDSESGEGDKSGKSGPSANGPAKMTEEERKQLKAELKQEIITSAQMSGIGKLPAGIQRLINDLIAPKMDWKTLLQNQLSSIIPSDYSFLRVNRKGWHMDAILPGMVEEQMLSIAVALDMSGSISPKMVQEFLSEVKGIMDQYPMYEIKVFCFDTECYSDRTFSTDNGEDICTYEARGGGGTDGGAIFRHLKEENIVPMKLVVFTDGYVGDFGDENYCPTVWIISGSNVVPPFGMHANYDATV
jgi:predicted metal-dependent peptidase